MNENTKSRPDLAALKAAAEKATPGPWGIQYYTDEDSPYETVTYPRSIRSTSANVAVLNDFAGEDGPEWNLHRDTEFIVALRNAFPALCETLERYEAALNLLRDRATPHGWVWHLADRALAAGEK